MWMRSDAWSEGTKQFLKTGKEWTRLGRTDEPKFYEPKFKERQVIFSILKRWSKYIERLFTVA